jgi:hypothetical protein
MERVVETGKECERFDLGSMISNAVCMNGSVDCEKMIGSKMKLLKLRRLWLPVLSEACSKIEGYDIRNLIMLIFVRVLGSHVFVAAILDGFG